MRETCRPTWYPTWHPYVHILSGSGEQEPGRSFDQPWYGGLGAENGAREVGEVRAPGAISSFKPQGFSVSVMAAFWIGSVNAPGEVAPPPSSSAEKPLDTISSSDRHCLS